MKTHKSTTEDEGHSQGGGMQGGGTSGFFWFVLQLVTEFSRKDTQLSSLHSCTDAWGEGKSVLVGDLGDGTAGLRLSLQ